MSGYNIQELSQMTGISVRSLRNYLRQYDEFLHPDRGACNALVFDDEDVETFLKIRTFLREGKSRDEIKGILAGAESAGEVMIRRADPTGSPEFSEIARGMELQNKLLERLVQENSLLRERLDILEVRLALRDELPPGTERRPFLPAPVPRKIPVRSGALRVDLPVPYFMLRLKDGAVAAVRAVFTTVFSRGRAPRPAPRA